jgi:hypothetical protein
VTSRCGVNIPGDVYGTHFKSKFSRNTHHLVIALLVGHYLSAITLGGYIAGISHSRCIGACQTTLKGAVRLARTNPKTYRITTGSMWVASASSHARYGSVWSGCIRGWSTGGERKHIHIHVPTPNQIPTLKTYRVGTGLQSNGRIVVVSKRTRGDPARPRVLSVHSNGKSRGTALLLVRTGPYKHRRGLCDSYLLGGYSLRLLKLQRCPSRVHLVVHNRRPSWVGKALPSTEAV